MSGTPLCVLGGPALVFKRKTQDVVVPLSAHTMQKLQCSFCIPLWDFMGRVISASHYATHVGFKTTLVVLFPVQDFLFRYQL